MAKRYVNKSGKDKDGDITKLCNAGEAWSPRKKADAISDIENKVHEYFVKWTDGQETPIRVVNGATGIVGPIGPGNSLVGSHEGDFYWAQTIVLANGNFIVINPEWDNGGAVNLLLRRRRSSLLR